MSYTARLRHGDDGRCDLAVFRYDGEVSTRIYPRTEREATWRVSRAAALRHARRVKARDEAELAAFPLEDVEL